MKSKAIQRVEAHARKLDKMWGFSSMADDKDEHDVMTEEETNKAPVMPVYGWLCPKCGAGVAPHVTVCPCTCTPIQWGL